VPLDRPDAAAARFLAKQGELWAPRFWLLAADGDVVTGAFGAPIPVMTIQGGVHPAHEAEVPSVARLLAVVENGILLDRAQRALLRWTAGEGVPADALRDRADVLTTRARFAEAVECRRALVRAAEAEGGPALGAAREDLAEALVRDGRREDAVREYAALAESSPGDPRALRRRLRAALVRHGLHDGLPGVIAEGTAGEFRALLGDAEASGDEAAQAEARLGRGYGLAELGRFEEARTMVAWLGAHRGDGAWPPAFALGAARLALRLLAPEEAAAWLESLLRHHPTSPEADVARHGVLDEARMLARRPADPSRAPSRGG
jgi:tetratricopeptide (TPR) repeat protein